MLKKIGYDMPEPRYGLEDAGSEGKFREEKVRENFRNVDLDELVHETMHEVPTKLEYSVLLDLMFSFALVNARPFSSLC
jgi:hypothetical protein